MRVIKLDRRHKHSSVYSAALQFSKFEFTKARYHWIYRRALEQMYGEETIYNRSENGELTGTWKFNENYRIDRVKYRINVKDASVITMLELMVAK